ncbi:hypothetical protein [Streptomyces syringium]|uniref:hypothetical protein n=1 Tax=Streptomyces syringium TaxID=76729 RepID=UPI003428ECC7
MASHARHARSKSPRPGLPRGLVRVGVSVSAGAAIVAGGAASANAAPAKDSAQPVGVSLGEISAESAGTALGQSLYHSSAGALGPLKVLRLNPLAGTGSDPTDNAVGTQVADFQPVSTAMLTAPLSQGGALEQLPLLSYAAQFLPG